MKIDNPKHRAHYDFDGQGDKVLYCSCGFTTTSWVAMEEHRKNIPIDYDQFLELSQPKQAWLIYQSILSLNSKLDIIMPQLSDILTNEATELADLGTIGSAITTVINEVNSLTTQNANLQAQITAGNTEPADLQTIATAQAQSLAALAPIMTALAAAVPAVTATPAAPPAG